MTGCPRGPDYERGCFDARTAALEQRQKDIESRLERAEAMVDKLHVGQLQHRMYWRQLFLLAGAVAAIGGKLFWDAVDWIKLLMAAA